MRIFFIVRFCSRIFLEMFLMLITDRKNGSKRVQTDGFGPSLTEKGHAKRCDINWKMARFKKTGVLPGIDGVEFFYGDFSAGATFYDAQNAVFEARSQFMRLPAEIRRRFDQDPGKLIDFLADPANQEEAIELGLVEDPETSYKLQEPDPGPEAPNSDEEVPPTE